MKGKPLVPSNPLLGLQRPREKNIRRPIDRHDRYLKTLEKADVVDLEGRLRCMLGLARYTGHRTNAICNLLVTNLLRTPDAFRAEIAAMGQDESRAEYFSFGGLPWRGALDKQGFDTLTPLSEHARAALDAYLEQNPRVGDVPLFSAPGDPSTPIRRDLAGNWLVRAEELAGLPKLAGGRWHPYRRLFATELKGIPMQDVAAAGGWKSIETVQRIYQQSEAKGVLGAVQRIGQPQEG